MDGLAARRAVRTDLSPSVHFTFRELLHEPGTKTLLSIAYQESGEAEGDRALRALCRHPSTALFVATKLVAHFVGDEPPPPAVEHVARAFRDSDGDLAVVSRSLIDLPDAWRADLRKFRPPQDWIVAVLRAFGTTEVPDSVPGVLRQLRHPFWSPQSPKGFGDSTQEWADPDALLNRAELARSMARRLRGRVDPRTLVEVVDVPGGSPLRDLLFDDSVPVDERVALAIAGPAFQWR